MQSPLYIILVLHWFVAASLSAKAQGGQTVQAYLQLGQHYEKQGENRKALDMYRKAQAAAAPADRKSLDPSIDRLDDLIQQQALVSQARADAVQRRIASLANPQTRSRLQDDLASLQQQDQATPADYQNLLRRVEAAKDVETEVAAGSGHSPASAGRVLPTSHRPVPPPRPTDPPPKAIMVSGPAISPNEASGSRPTRKTKSAASLPNIGSKPN